MCQFTDEKFEEMVNKYHDILSSIAYTYMHDKYYVEDIIQDSFFKLYKARKRFENEDHIKNWLIRVTINGCIDALRHKTEEVFVGEEYLNNLSDNPDVDKDNNDDIYDCICSLKDSYKTIVILYYYNDYSIKDIANVLKISETNASSRLARARAKLKEIILERRSTNEQ